MGQEPWQWVQYFFLQGPTWRRPAYQMAWARVLDPELLIWNCQWQERFQAEAQVRAWLMPWAGIHTRVCACVCPCTYPPTLLGFSGFLWRKSPSFHQHFKSNCGPQLLLEAWDWAGLNARSRAMKWPHSWDAVFLWEIQQKPTQENPQLQ